MFFVSLSLQWRTCSEQWTLNSTRFKLFIELFYYVLIISVLTASLSLEAAHSGRYRADLREFLICSATGADDCPRDHEDHTFLGISAIAYMLMGLYPIPLLIYFINFKDLKRIFCGPRVKTTSTEG